MGDKPHSPTDLPTGSAPGRVWKISPTVGFNPRTDQPVQSLHRPARTVTIPTSPYSHYTDHATPLTEPYDLDTSYIKFRLILFFKWVYSQFQNTLYLQISSNFIDETQFSTRNFAECDYSTLKFDIKTNSWNL